MWLYFKYFQVCRVARPSSLEPCLSLAEGRSTTRKFSIKPNTPINGNPEGVGGRGGDLTFLQNNVCFDFCTHWLHLPQVEDFGISDHMHNMGWV
jgi:hypothetical protein